MKYWVITYVVLDGEEILKKHNTFIIERIPTQSNSKLYYIIGHKRSTSDYEKKNTHMIIKVFSMNHFKDLKITSFY